MIQKIYKTRLNYLTLVLKFNFLRDGEGCWRQICTLRFNSKYKIILFNLLVEVRRGASVDTHLRLLPILGILQTVFEPTKKRPCWRYILFLIVRYNLLLRPLTRKPGQSFYLPTLLVSSLNVCELALNSATRAECVLQWLPNIWLLKRRLGEPPVYLFSSALLDCLQFSSPQLSYISCSLSPAFFEINAIYNAEITLYNKATLNRLCSVPNG